MSVLMLGWEFPPVVHGGLGTACFGLTQALTKKNIPVTFVLPRYPVTKKPDNPKLQMRSASAVSHLSKPTVSYEKNVHSVWGKTLRVRPLDSLLFPYATEESYEETFYAAQHEESKRSAENTSGNTWYELKGDYGKDLMSEVYRYSHAVGRLSSTENFEVIHAHDWMTFPAGMVVKKISGKPLIAHVHALESDRSGHNVNHEVAQIERRGLEAADCVVAVSHLTKRMIVNNYGINPEKIHVVHNAVARKDAAVYHKDQVKPPYKIVLFMGRVTFQKGPEYFIKAASLVLKKLPDVQFVMAGSGDMLKRMIMKAARLRIGSHMHFTGFLRGSDVDRMYAMSDLYVMPSVSEPFGIAPLEAMVYDVPVIISKQSGVAEVIKNALKVDFWDVQDMANKICAVLEHPQMASEVAQNCKEELKSIKWDNAATLLQDVYKKAQISARRQAYV